MCAFGAIVRVSDLHLEKGRVKILFSKIATIDTKRSVVAGKQIGRPVVRLPPSLSHSQGMYDHLPLRHRITYKDDPSAEKQETGDQESAAYIKNIMALEIAMPNTDKETGNVRVPIYYGDPGMSRRVPLPAAAYMLFRTPRSNLRFWTNTAQVCLARDGRNVHDVMNRLRMDLTQRARLMVEMCCALVQSLDYIGDVFDMNKRFTQRVEGFLSGSPDVVFNPAYVKGKSSFSKKTFLTFFLKKRVRAIWRCAARQDWRLRGSGAGNHHGVVGAD